jgi:hypothetical protein
MKHAREDYNRIQDPVGKIPADEPVFLLRAQDKSAPDTVRGWALENLRNGGDVQLSKLAERHADAMEAWQDEHGSKPADAAPAAQAAPVDALPELPPLHAFLFGSLGDLTGSELGSMVQYYARAAQALVRATPRVEAKPLTEDEVSELYQHGRDWGETHREFIVKFASAVEIAFCKKNSIGTQPEADKGVQRG